MMQYFKSVLLFSFIFMTISSSAQVLNQTKLFEWGELPAVPDDFGFAGAFGGVANGALIVAGGANFPDGGAPWTGSKKVWSDKIYVLDHPKGKWEIAGKLPEPLGYGISITHGERLICIGGSNEVGHTAKVYAIADKNGQVNISQLADLPETLANSSGALIGDIVYVAGGLKNADSQSTSNAFWSLDLADPNAKWQKLDTWPGTSRMLAVAGSSGNSFYLFSGTDLKLNAAGQAERVYLTDAYSYQPKAGWKKLKDLPKPVVAAAGPAYKSNTNKLLIFGGDDGKLAPKAAELEGRHPGFSDEILSFDIAKNEWCIADTILKNIKEDAVTNPNGSIWPAVTNTMVIWNGNLVFSMGEVRPAVRTPRVIIARPIAH